ncbi:uncharacterized protein LOC113321718 [Papaver somniferum]|uniref:uncharacterized protein LOC113321718 n=1 Tax=Papaver somniferum TaxID=3469 RepID=UPI000E705407|nr:uncharacterized protein LOC113321718 [Papaver somniferum]XP_026425410.1 uncharacterized protein LOC113321718 [Papaver somniferum]
MLSSLRRILSQTTSFNGGNSATINLLPFLYNQKNPSFSIGIRFSSSPPKHEEPSSSSSSFVINYLISSCGLTENQAITASRKLNFTTTTKPDSVLNLLENYGFTQPHISKTISKLPSLLLNNPQKTLQPKLDFFKSKGISGLDLAKFISGSPSILNRSLQDSIIRCCNTLENIVHRDKNKNVVTIIKWNSWLLMSNLGIKAMMVNIDILRDEGVPQPNIINFLIYQPRALTIRTGRLKEIVKEIKGLGIDPYKTTYLKAIQLFAGLSKSTMESRVNFYRRLGWSEEEIHRAFRSYPQCMMQSEKKITSVMDYLVNQMGCNPAEWPAIFSCSLKKRIIPRCSAYKILTSKGLVTDQIPLSSLMKIGDEPFWRSL